MDKWIITIKLECPDIRYKEYEDIISNLFNIDDNMLVEESLVREVDTSADMAE